MELSTAIQLVERGISPLDVPQRWADLGAGDGLFTRALGSILPKNSFVLAVDQNAKSIGWNFKTVNLQILAADFTSANFGIAFDGILMANSLHYVRDQGNFLRAIGGKLGTSGRLIIVEYELRLANTWVPYPVNFMKLKEVGEDAGFSSIVKLHEAPSIYNDAIYSAVLTL